MRIYSTIVGPVLWNIPEITYFNKIDVVLEPIEDIILDCSFGFEQTGVNIRHSTKSYCDYLIAGQIQAVEALFVEQKTAMHLAQEFLALRSKRTELISRGYAENVLAAINEAQEMADRISFSVPGLSEEASKALFKEKTKYKFIIVCLISAFLSVKNNNDLGTEIYFDPRNIVDESVYNDFVKTGIEEIKYFTSKLTMSKIEILSLLRVDYMKKIISL